MLAPKTSKLPPPIHSLRFFRQLIRGERMIGNPRGIAAQAPYAVHLREAEEFGGDVAAAAGEQYTQAQAQDR